MPAMSEEKEREQEIAIRTAHIMQAVAEELDEKGKRMWRKMLGIEGKKEIRRNRKP